MAKIALDRTPNPGRAKLPGRRLPENLQALADRLCPRRSEGAEELELVPSAGRKLEQGQATAHAIDRVTAVVAQTCTWGRPVADWHVGDYRFLILSFTIRKDVGFYVQLWTEPEEPVLVEACSGAWNPPARPYIRGPQRAALRKLGYRIGGRARNYQKHWTLSPMADARALARELLTLLVDVYGYRGSRPLNLTYCSDGRTEAAPVFPALAIDDVRRMLAIGGCRVASAESAAAVSPRVRARLIHVDQPFPFVVEMRAQSGRTPVKFDALRFLTALPGGREMSSGHVEALVRECPFARIFRDEQGDLILAHDLLVSGTTVRWFLMALHMWKQTRERAGHLLRFMLAVPAPAGPGPGGGQEDGADPDDAGLEEQEEGGSGQTGRSRVTVH